MKNIFNYFIKPIYELKELPDAIKHEVTKTRMICIFSLLFGLIYSISKFNLFYFFLVLFMSIIYILVFYVLWYRYFSYGKVIFYDGVVVKINHEINVRNKIKHVFNRFVRRTFKIRLDNDLVVNIVAKNNKVQKEGIRIRVYTLPGNVLCRKDKSYFINNALFIEILENKE